MDQQELAKFVKLIAARDGDGKDAAH
jgi:hypothetical protein